MCGPKNVLFFGGVVPESWFGAVYLAQVYICRDFRSSILDVAPRGAATFSIYGTCMGSG